MAKSYFVGGNCSLFCVLGMAFMLSACNGKSSVESVSHTNSVDTVIEVSSDSVASMDTVSPIAPRLVEVSSITPGEASVSWLPAVDDQTPSDQLSYTVHVSTTEGFNPTDANKVAELTGETSFNADGLTVGSDIYVIVKAIDSSGNSSMSNSLQGKIANITPTRSASNVIGVSASNSQLMQRGTSPTLATTQSVSVGDVLLDPSGDSAPHKVTHVAQAKGGSPTVSTEPASLNEIFTDVEFNTRVKLYDVPNTTAITGLQARGINVAAINGVSWENTGLSLTGGDNASSKLLSKESDPSDLSLDGGKQTDKGSYFERKRQANYRSEISGIAQGISDAYSSGLV